MWKIKSRHKYVKIKIKGVLVLIFCVFLKTKNIVCISTDNDSLLLNIFIDTGLLLLLCEINNKKTQNLEKNYKVESSKQTKKNQQNGKFCEIKGDNIRMCLDITNRWVTKKNISNNF